MINSIEICDRCKKETPIVVGDKEHEFKSIPQYVRFEATLFKAQYAPQVFSLCGTCERDLGKFIWNK